MPLSDTDDLAARALYEWVTGIRSVGDRIVFAEPDAPVAGLTGLLSADDILIVSDTADLSAIDASTRATVVSYAGQWGGDQLFLGRWTVEFQDYVAAAYVEILGSTAVQVTGPAGWEAFLDDADSARRSGVFPDVVLDPRIQIAECDALTHPWVSERPRSVYVRSDGGITLGPLGVRIDDRRDAASALDTHRPRLSALAGAVSYDLLASNLSARPWLGRYLRVGTVLQALRVDPARVRVVGFGRRLLEDERHDAEPSVEAPFLVETDEGFLLADLMTSRRQRLSEPTAVVVEGVQTSSTEQLAVARIASRLGIDRPSAESLCVQARRALGVQPGVVTPSAVDAIGNAEAETRNRESQP